MDFLAVNCIDAFCARNVCPVSVPVKQKVANSRSAFFLKRVVCVPDLAGQGGASLCFSRVSAFRLGLTTQQKKNNGRVSRLGKLWEPAR